MVHLMPEKCVIRQVYCYIMGLTHGNIYDERMLCYDMNLQVYWIGWGMEPLLYRFVVSI